jgi:RHS repeat-associated protein
LRIGMSRGAAIRAERSWSTASGLSQTTTFAFEGSINRYYDPSTDQFLSVDLDVQTTDQPYVFTNDDPLNATDPLGLKGGVADACYAAESNSCYRQAVQAVKKAASTPIMKVLTNAYVSANNFANHVVVGFGGYIDVCLNLSLQGTHVTLSVGEAGGAVKGPYIGYSNLLPNQRQNTQVFNTEGLAVGGSTSIGVRPNGSIDTKDWEVDVGPVTGSAGGLMWSKTVNLWP